MAPTTLAFNRLDRARLWMSPAQRMPIRSRRVLARALCRTVQASWVLAVDIVRSNDRPVTAQGWYLDPFDQHEQRWFSAGEPTALVRDQGVESHDGPTEWTWTGSLVEPDPVVNVNDLRRADEATAVDQSVTKGEVILAPFEGSGALGIGFT